MTIDWPKIRLGSGRTREIGWIMGRAKKVAPPALPAPNSQRASRVRPLPPGEPPDMPYENFPDMIRGRYFPTAESYHDFLRDIEYRLLDDDDLEDWLAWPRRAKPAAPTHEILTAEEACRYLRLDIGRDSDAAIKALNRLVDKGRIRPCLVGKHRRYTRDELCRFIGATTERYGDTG